MWKRLTSYPNYEVSDEGQIRNLTTGKPLKQSLTNKGYLTVRPSHNGVAKLKLVHHLVAECFLPPKPSSIHTIDHEDRVRTHNAKDNLRWRTPLEQSANREPFHGEMVTISKLTDEIILIARARRVTGEKVTVIAKDYGVTASTMWKAITGATWKHLPTAHEAPFFKSGS